MARYDAYIFDVQGTLGDFYRPVADALARELGENGAAPTSFERGAAATSPGSLRWISLLPIGIAYRTPPHTYLPQSVKIFAS